MGAQAGTLVQGVDFILVNVGDLDRARRFYRDVLGLEESSVWQREGSPAIGAEYETGTVTIALMDVAQTGREFVPAQTAVVLRVDDVPAARERLEADGVTFHMDDVIDSGFCHQLYFSDSEGNTLGLHHRYVPKG